MTTTTRQTADERRTAVLVTARKEFAEKGLHGASTDDIARAAGISQPYLFRLFGTKKELYLATAREANESLYAVFERASRGKTGKEAAAAMGRGVQGDPRRSRSPPDAAEVLDLVRRSRHLRDGEVDLA